MYELLGIKWGEPVYGTPSGTINWQEDLGGLTSSTGDVDDLVNTLNAAFERWEDVAAINFREGGSLDVTISYASFLGDSDPLNDSSAGVASWSDAPGLDEPVGATITFNSDLLWAPNGSGGTDFYAVALHEIGHIIGLAHVWEFGDPVAERDPSILMNALIEADDLGDADIEGAQYIYGTDGDEPVDDRSGGGGGGGAIGLLVGILALIAAVFTGGVGAAVAMAAGAVPGGRGSDDDEADAPETIDYSAKALGTNEFYDVGEDGQVTHYISVEDMVYLPRIDFTAIANPCGCVGLCGHIIDMDGIETDDVFI